VVTPKRRGGPVQAGQHLGVALEEPGLAIRHAVLPAEALNERPRPTQAKPAGRCDTISKSTLTTSSTTVLTRVLFFNEA
jgi:hypothetical protein